MTVEDLAAFLVVPVASVYAFNSRGSGPRRIRVGRYVRYRRKDVDAWIDQRAAPVGFPA